jgi:hypothetical protein
LGNQIHLSDIGSDNYFMVNNYDRSGVAAAIRNTGRNPAGMHLTTNNVFGSNQINWGNWANLQAPGCPNLNNWTAICPKGSVQVGMTNACGHFYPICKKLS